MLERDRRPDGPPRRPIPTTGNHLHGVHTGRGLRRGHQNRGAIRPVPLLRCPRRRGRRGRLARRGDRRRDIHDPHLPVSRVPASAQAGLAAKYSDYIDALGGVRTPSVLAGIIVGQAAANDLIVYRAGDRDESITYAPPPLTPGAWTFAPPPSLQTAQTPWAAVMRPFMLNAPPSSASNPHPPSTAPNGRGNTTKSRPTERSTAPSAPPTRPPPRSSGVHSRSTNQTKPSRTS